MKKPWRAIIVDDELTARQHLRTLLAEHPEVQVIGEAADALSAEVLCNQHDPDLLFLDVQLRQTAGFDLLPRLRSMPAVILLSAQANSAAQANEIGVRDYLLKPVHPDRLAQTIHRVTGGLPPKSAAPDQRTVMVKTGRKEERFPIAEITHIQAMDNYSMVHFRNSPSLMVRRTLQQWQRLLPPAKFLRVERSYILNISEVGNCHSVSRDAYEVTLTHAPAPLVLGRPAAQRLKQAMRQG